MPLSSFSAEYLSDDGQTKTMAGTSSPKNGANAISTLFPYIGFGTYPEPPIILPTHPPSGIPSNIQLQNRLNNQLDYQLRNTDYQRVPTRTPNRHPTGLPTTTPNRNPTGLPQLNHCAACIHHLSHIPPLWFPFSVLSTQRRWASGIGGLVPIPPDKAGILSSFVVIDLLQFLTHSFFHLLWNKLVA